MCADDKVQLYKTGGGPLMPNSLRGFEKVRALIEPTITPLHNNNDSDAYYHGDSVQGKLTYKYNKLKLATGLRQLYAGWLNLNVCTSEPSKTQSILTKPNLI